MVQADPRRDYYADLGVAASADESEIKKAFRNLAKLYHPDRNAGREAESVAKFQQIQAAYEILSDKTQRAKYDQQRRKYRPSASSYTPSPRPAPTPTRGAYSTHSGSYYQPPPPRPPPPQHHSTFANGAERFTSKNFRAPPTAQRPTPRHASEEKANVFTAWQKMKQPQGEEKRAREQNPNNPNGTPFGRSKSARAASSKKGFDPSTPGVDEAPAARGGYRSTYERPIPTAPPAPDSFEAHAHNVDINDVPYAEGNRVRTPYFSKAGERTSMYGDAFSRSASTRASPRESPTQRPRSYAEVRGYPGSGTNTPRKPSVFGYDNPFGPMYVSSDDDSDSGEDLINSRRHPKPSASSKPPPPPRANPSSGTAQQAPGIFNTGFGTRPMATPKSFHSRSEESINMKFSPSNWHGKFEGSPDHFAPNFFKGATGSGQTSPLRGRAAQRSSTQRSPFSGASQPPPPVSPFEVPPPAPMPPPPPGPPPMSTKPPTTFDGATWANTFKSPEFAIPQAKPGVKFPADQWQQTFQTPHFAMPTTKETSPKRAANTSKRAKANPRKPSAGPAARKVETPSEEKKPEYQAFAEDAGSDEPEAMDIDDSSTQPAETPVPQATEQPAPTGVKGDFTMKPGTPIKFSSPSDAAPSVGAMPAPSTTPSAAPKPRTSGGLPNGTGPLLTPADPLGPSTLDGLSGLGKVEPLAPSTDKGISGISDLHDTLPFPSAASSSHPLKASLDHFDYPRVPNAPEPPSPLTLDGAKIYLKQMEVYVKAYLKYNREMMAVLTAHMEETESNMDNNWMSNRGETTRKFGYQSYMTRMGAEDPVFTAWAIAREMHRKAMEKAGDVRRMVEKMKLSKGAVFTGLGHARRVRKTKRSGTEKEQEKVRQAEKPNVIVHGRKKGVELRSPRISVSL